MNQGLFKTPLCGVDIPIILEWEMGWDEPITWSLFKSALLLSNSGVNDLGGCDESFKPLKP